MIKIENPAADTARNNAPFVGRDGVAMERRHEDDMSLAIMERACNKGVHHPSTWKDPRGRELFLRLASSRPMPWSRTTAPAPIARHGLGPAPSSTRASVTSISGFADQHGVAARTARWTPSCRRCRA